MEKDRKRRKELFLKIGLISAKLPPEPDGIGDYTDRLARSLSAHAEVKAYSGTPGQHPYASEDPFRVGDLGSFPKLRSAIQRDRPDWVILQYNPFFYGRWGLNPALPRALAGLGSGIRLGVMVHEPFVPIRGPKSLVLSVLQQAQLRALARSADQLFFSIEFWNRKFGHWFGPEKCAHLPVGSNIERGSFDRARGILGLSNSDLIVGVFGSDHPSRPIGHFVRAIESLSGMNARLLTAGGIGKKLLAALSSRDRERAISLGMASPEEVSRAFSAMDLYLCPYQDGASTRRTALMTGLQHGIPTVTTIGELSDGIFREEAGKSFLAPSSGDEAGFAAQVRSLGESADLRRRLGEAGTRLYRGNFDWPIITSKLLNLLKMRQ